MFLIIDINELLKNYLHKSQLTHKTYIKRVMLNVAYNSYNFTLNKRLYFILELYFVVVLCFVSCVLLLFAFVLFLFVTIPSCVVVVFVLFLCGGFLA